MVILLTKARRESEYTVITDHRLPFPICTTKQTHFHRRLLRTRLKTAAQPNTASIPLTFLAQEREIGRLQPRVEKVTPPNAPAVETPGLPIPESGGPPSGSVRAAASDAEQRFGPPLKLPAAQIETSAYRFAGIHR